ncbi:MAG: hypothetical protein ABWX74_02365 [Aeromicrobium sp.]
MARRRVVGAACVTLLAAAAVLVVVWQWPGQEDDRGPGARSAESVATSSPAPPDNDVTNGDGTEVIRQPEGSEASGLPGLRAVRSDPTESLLRAAPPTASRRGALVTGFPVSVVPVLPGSSLGSSGVSSTRDAVQVSIVATSPRSSDAVLAFYRRALRGHDFVESVVPAAAGAVAAGFRRGSDHLVVTTTRDASETSYSVFGTLHADADG